MLDEQWNSGVAVMGRKETISNFGRNKNQFDEEKQNETKKEILLRKYNSTNTHIQKSETRTTKIEPKNKPAIRSIMNITSSFGA